MSRMKTMLLAVTLLVSTLTPVEASGATSKPDSSTLFANVQFANETDGTKISKRKLLEFEQTALQAIQQESKPSLQISPTEAERDGEIFNYITADESYTYIYESYSDGRQPNILIGENSELSISDNSENQITPMAAVDLPGGWGGRQKITSSGNTLTTSVALPSSVTRIGNAYPYIYVGFSGSRESDMGLQHNINRGPAQNQRAWVPFMTLSGGINVGQVAPNDQVGYKNGFREGANIGIQAHRNYNSTGKVRLVTFGYALCSDMYCTNTGSYYMTAINEYSMSVPSVNFWKVLATYAAEPGQPEGKGAFQTTFNNIAIDFSPVPNGSFQTPETDYSTITRSSNNVTINVNKP